MATFWIAAILVLCFIPMQIVNINSDKINNVESFFSKISGGFTSIWNDSAMRSLTALVMIQSILISTLFSVLLPTYVDQQFHNPEALGVMVAAFGGGALVGSILYVSHASHLSLALTVILSCAAVSLSLLTIVISSDLYVSVAALAVGGFAISPVGPAAFTFIGHRFPAHMRGRVLAAFGAAASSGIPLGAISIGFAVQLAGVHVVLGSSAVLFAILAIYSALAVARSEGLIVQHDES
jgi:MFS family permease